MVKIKKNIFHKIENIFFFFSFLLYSVKGLEDTIYDYLNDLKTIKTNQKFSLCSSEESIAYFDSEDKNSIVYITDEEGIKERIDGFFYNIEANKKYTINVNLYSSDNPSMLISYFDWKNLTKYSIFIKDNDISNLYLIKNYKFELNFADNSIKKVLSLSRKTLNSEIKIYYNNKKLSELNRNNLYYVIPDNFKGSLILEIEKEDAFIKFLSIPEEKDDHIYIMARTSFNKYEIEFKTSTLFIPYTQKQIEIQLYSNQSFKYSLSGGFSSSSSDSWYYYNSTSNWQIESPKIGKNKYSVTIKFPNIYKDISLKEREYFTLSIGLNYDKTKVIYLDYKQFSDIDPLLDEELTEIYCNKVIKNFQDLFEIYVYSDIAKNPPNDVHEKININERLSKISTKNRYFYEFYQDIETIIGAVKDRHLNIVGEKTPKGIPLVQYFAHLPFNFKIKQFGDDYRIFIEKNKNFIKKFDKNVQTFVENHKDIPLKYINDMDPFHYIQNWSQFRGVKNMHAQFTLRISEISNFKLREHPLNYTDMSLNEYEFEDDEILRVGYYIEKPIIQDDLKFDNYILNIVKNDENINDIPSLDKIYNDYLIFSGKKMQPKINYEISNLNVQWNSDFSHTEKKNGNNMEIKCTIDQTNMVNVIYQNSFAFSDIEGVIGKMLKCIKSFYNNDYPIIIIESNNRGGKVILYTTLLQFLQPLIEFKDYRSYRITPISKEYFKKRNIKGSINTFDCKELNSFEDINNFIEDSYNDSSIKHIRTFPHDPLKKIYRLALKEYREEILKQKNIHIKKPTDIIIFTDSYSYSATSGLIKGFQNTGSAVTVGYFGNPKRNDLFDASQSSSTVDNRFNNRIKIELKKLGFTIIGVTILESYNFHQKNMKDQIPREYAIDPVDFRVNIYSHYSDNIYDTFIKEGLRIHHLLNKDNQCNPENDILFLHDDKCHTIEGDKYAHGGYKCNKTNGMWDKSKCEPYYCDIGYYFDQIQKKCIENCNYPDEKSFFIYEDTKAQTFKLEKNIKYHFIFLFFNSRNYFTTITDDTDNKAKYPIIFPEKTFHPTDYDRTLEINEVNTNMEFIIINKLKTKYSFISIEETIIYIETSKNNILYIDNIYKSSKTELQIAEYKNSMTIDEIINHDSKYFSKLNNNIHILTSELYILYVKMVDLDSFTIFMNPFYNTNFFEETIEIKDLETDILYLEIGKIYELDFANNKINRIMKLSRETINSKIIIHNKHKILNASNLYYEIPDDFKGKLTLYVKKENAIIEFLFKQDYSDYDIIKVTDSRIFTLNKKYNILPIDIKYKSKKIEIELTNNGDTTDFSIYMAYTIPPYNFFSKDESVNTIKINEKKTFTINEHYEGDINLMPREFYCVMIENFGEDVILEVRGMKSKRLNGWEIAIFIALLIIIL